MEQSDRKEAYLNELTEQIRCKKAREWIAEEYACHIEDQAFSFEKEGDDRETALSRALEQMGDPVEAGKQLDQIHRPRMEWNVLGIVLALCCIGLYTIQSMDAAFTVEIGRQFFFIVIGLLCMSGIYFMDYTILGRYPKTLWTVFVAVFFLLVPFESMVNSSRTYINGSLNYVCAFGLLFVPLYGGILYAYRKRGYSGMLVCLAIGMLTSIVEGRFIRQSSIYIGILIISMIMLTVAVLKDWFHTSKRWSLLIIWGWPPVLLAVCALLGQSVFRSYPMERMKEAIRIMLHPSLYPHGYQQSITRQVMEHARVFGGAGEYSLPPDLMKNDYILTYIIGKWGIAAGIAMIGLILGFIGRLLYLASKQKNMLGMFLGLGCSLVLALESVIYILSNLSIQLVAQVNLPFLSYGGCSMVINFILLGLMLCVFRNTNIIKERPYKQRYSITIVKTE